MLIIPRLGSCCFHCLICHGVCSRVLLSIVSCQSSPNYLLMCVCKHPSFWGAKRCEYPPAVHLATGAVERGLSATVDANSPV